MNVVFAAHPGEFRGGCLNVGVGVAAAEQLPSPEFEWSVASMRFTPQELAPDLYPGEADSVVVPSAIRFVASNELPSMMLNLTSLLAKGGTLAITGHDLGQLVGFHHDGYLTEAEVNALLYEAGTVATHSTNSVASAMESAGLTIRRQTMHHHDYTVVGERTR